MFCPNCGRELADGSKFCSGCGAPVPQNVNATQASPTTESSPQQPAPSQKPKSKPKPVIVLVILAIVLLLGVIVLASLVLFRHNEVAPSDYQNGSQSETSAIETDTKKGGDTESTAKQESGKTETDPKEKSDDTKEDAKDPKEKSDDTKEDAKDPKEKSDDTKEDDDLRAKAKANGEQTFEGKVLMCNGTQAASILHTEDALRANGPRSEESESNTQYALLELDNTSSVYVSDYYDGPITRDADYIELGEHRYSVEKGDYSGDDTASSWSDYDGAHVCIAAKNFNLSDGVSVITVPTTKNARLLYTLDAGEAAAEPNAESENGPTQQEAYDPLKFSSDEKTFETMDFVVTVPDEWVGIWEYKEPKQEGDTCLWLFTVPDSSQVVGFDGGGILVTPDSGSPSPVEGRGAAKPVFEEPSSNGMYLWYVGGDPQCFFKDMDGKATISLK